MRGEKGGAEEEEYGREEHVISKLDCSSILYRCICRRISGEVSIAPLLVEAGAMALQDVTPQENFQGKYYHLTCS